MARESPRPPSLPEPPKVDRRIRIPAHRAVGLALIALVPVLAVLGVFGERRNTADAAAGAVAVQVEYPTRYRYEMLNSITATVTNRSARLIDTVVVRLDSAYTLRFSAVVFTPAAERAFAVPLTDLAPGETRLVEIELQGERYGRHSGDLHFESTTGDTLVVPLRTVIFP